MANIASQTEYAEERARDVANPVPLGMITLAFTTALVGCSFAHFLVPTARTGIGLAVGAAIFYGGIVQILAGMWEFRKNNTIAATIFSAYGGFLLAFGVLFLPPFGLNTLFGADSTAFNHALGLLFLCWTITLGVLCLSVLRTNIALLSVLALLFLSYLFLTIGSFANANFPLLAIGGWLGIVAALVAWYAALAGIVQYTKSPFRLPMGYSA